MLLLPYSIAFGVITAMSGTILNIPPGWSLCDGTNGTPDMTDKFIMGAGLSFAVGNEGGWETHTHPFLTDPHLHIIPAAAGLDYATPGQKSFATSSISVF